MIEAIITDLLTSSAPAAVSNPVADRVFPGIIPHKCQYPAIRHQSINNPASQRNSAGTQHTTKRTTYQIDVFAKTYLQAKSIADAIAAYLDGYSATHDAISIDLIEVTNVRPGYADGSEKHHHIVELTLTWRTLP